MAMIHPIHRLAGFCPMGRFPVCRGRGWGRAAGAAGRLRAGLRCAVCPVRCSKPFPSVLRARLVSLRRVYRFSGGIGMPQSSHRPLTTLPPHRLHFCIQDPPSTDSGYVLAARWAAVLRCMASEETVMRISAASRYQGNSDMLNCWASSPKKGGSSVVPV